MSGLYRTGQRAGRIGGIFVFTGRVFFDFEKTNPSGAGDTAGVVAEEDLQFKITRGEPVLAERGTEVIGLAGNSICRGR